MLNKMPDIITIDGPTASGKSTVGLLFAQKIGYQFIDSGLIFRAGAWQVVNVGVKVGDWQKIRKIYQNLKLGFKTIDSEQRVLLDGLDVTPKLHSPQVSQLVPILAAKRFVRDLVQESQKSLARGQNTVISGRDIGTVVFPQADLKFYITASPQARAKRRFQQWKKQNHSLTFDSVLSEINKRDNMDMTRKISPLKVPKGALIIDTSKMSIKAVFEEMIKNFKKVTLKVYT